MTTYALTVSTDDLGLGVIDGARVIAVRRRAIAADQYPPIDALYRIESATNSLGVATISLKPDDTSTYHTVSVIDTDGVVVHDEQIMMPPSACYLHDVPAPPTGTASIVQFRVSGVDKGTPTTTRNVNITGNAVESGVFSTDTLTITITKPTTPGEVGADAAGSAAAAQAAAVQRSNHTGTQLASTISDFNATASAAAPVQSVNGNTGAVTVAEGVSRTTLQNTVLWFEDFLTHQSSLWARVTASSGVATTLANDVSMTGMANACGVLRVVWNATGGYCTVSTSTTLDNKRTSVTGKTASSLTAMAIDAYPASTTYDFQVFGGWGGFDNNGIASGTTEAALWYFDKDGLYLYTCTGGVSTTSTIALASSGITADAYFRIRIEYTSTAVNLYVDNVLKLTNTTNIPQTYMSTLSWMVRTASAMADYANANLSLDYIDQLFTLTTPRVLT